MWRRTTDPAGQDHDHDPRDLLEAEEALVLLHLQLLAWVHWLQRRSRIVLDPDLVEVTADAKTAQIRMTVAVHLPTVATRGARVSPIMPERALRL
jgi:hypothetical protein